MIDALSPSASVKAATQTEAQHKQGKLTAHERIDVLFDENSFENLPGGDMSVLTGCGTIHGRTVFVFAKDHTILDGSLSAAHAAKIIQVIQRALDAKAPLVGLFDSDGMRSDERLTTLTAYADMVRNHIQARGVIPFIATIMGPCIGGDTFAAALADITFMVSDTSFLCVTGPEITERVTGFPHTFETLGGAAFHTEVSGNADALFPDDITALLQLRRFIDFLPHHPDLKLPWRSFDRSDRVEASLERLIPDVASPYDIKDLILKIVDEDDFCELQKTFAANIVAGLARMGGCTVGIVANQPMVLGGVLDTDAARKAARFIHFCGSFRLPIITFIDTPGFLPGLDQETKGLAAQGAALFTAYTKADVSKIAVVLGQAFGPAYVMMASKHSSRDRVFAWPSARLGLVNAEDAILTAQTALQQGAIDTVIDPSTTRSYILDALSL